MTKFRMKLEALDKTYLELLKNLNRTLDISIEALEGGEVTQAMLGESLMVETAINNLEQDVKEEAIVLIARFQPTARDLRKLIMYIDSARLVERMGDLLKGGLSILTKLEKSENNITIYLYDKFLPLLKKIKKIYENYITTVVNEDINSLYALLAMDKEIDQYVKENTKFLVETMKSDYSIIESGTLLLLLDRKFERVSDHITHLVENLIFILKGDNIRRLELMDMEKKCEENDKN